MRDSTLDIFTLTSSSVELARPALLAAGESQSLGVSKHDKIGPSDGRGIDSQGACWTCPAGESSANGDMGKWPAPGVPSSTPAGTQAPGAACGGQREWTLSACAAGVQQGRR